MLRKHRINKAETHILYKVINLSNICVELHIISVCLHCSVRIDVYKARMQKRELQPDIVGLNAAVAACARARQFVVIQE